MNFNHTVYFCVAEILPVLKKYPDSLIKIYYENHMYCAAYNDLEEFNNLLEKFGHYKIHSLRYSNGNYCFII